MASCEYTLREIRNEDSADLLPILNALGSAGWEIVHFQWGVGTVHAKVLLQRTFGNSENVTGIPSVDLAIADQQPASDAGKLRGRRQIPPPPKG